MGNLALFIKSLKNLYPLFDLVILSSFLKDYLICGRPGPSWLCASLSAAVVSGACSPVPEHGHQGLRGLQQLGPAGSRAWAPESWCAGLVAWWCMRSPLTRDWTHVPCVGRHFLTIGLPGKPWPSNPTQKCTLWTDFKKKVKTAWDSIIYKSESQ